MFDADRQFRIRNLIQLGQSRLGKNLGMLWIWVALGSSVLLITALHYSTTPGLSELHAVYRYFYFLPIVYAALRFGFWGGLFTAVGASLLFAPHIFFKWGDFPQDSLNDLLVVVVLYGVALITGMTADRLRQAEMEQAKTACKLAASLQRLEQQGEELRRAERLSALGTLAGGLAHEIRNPLGIIRATAQLMAMECGPEASASVAESVEIVEKETARIETFIQDLLTFAGSALPDKQPVHIGPFLHQLQQRLAPVTAANSVELIVVGEDGLPPLALDERRMEQALVNLCMNSVQALGGPGCITLCTELVEEEGTHFFQIRVSDNGPGIAEQVRPFVFDPFFTTKEAGVGLGLAVVQRTVEDHQGRIWVTSEPGKGAVFTIRIPVEIGGG